MKIVNIIYGSLIILTILFFATGIYRSSIKSNEMSKNIGKEVVIRKDTLTIISVDEGGLYYQYKMDNGSTYPIDFIEKLLEEE